MKLLLAALALLLSDVAMAHEPIDDLYRQGVAARYAGQTKLAIELLSRAAAAHPADADIHLQLGLALLAAGRLDEAESALRRTLAIAPNYSDARVGLARLMQRRGQLNFALAELNQVPPGRPDAEALRLQMLQTAAARTDWTLDLDSGYSRLNRDRSDWLEASIRIGRQLPGRILVSATVEPSRRFGQTDVYSEARVERRFTDATSAYFLFGGTPEADYRPRWQMGVGGTQRILGGHNPTLFALDARQARYARGNIQTLNPGFEQYVGNGRGWITGRWINVFDENGRHHMGWLARGDVMANDRLRLFAGLGHGPETSEGVVLETVSVFGGLSFDATERMTLRLSLAHEDRPLGLVRTHVQIGAGFRF